LSQFNGETQLSAVAIGHGHGFRGLVDGGQPPARPFACQRQGNRPASGTQVQDPSLGGGLFFQGQFHQALGLRTGDQGVGVYLKAEAPEFLLAPNIGNGFIRLPPLKIVVKAADHLGRDLAFRKGEHLGIADVSGQSQQQAGFPAGIVGNLAKGLTGSAQKGCNAVYFGGRVFHHCIVTALGTALPRGIPYNTRFCP